MGFKKTSTIVCSLIVINLYLAGCQNSPSLDWKFDPFSTDQWFKQKLDHYDSTSIQYWPQRYVTSYRFYRLGGPIFLFLSGPGPELSLTDIESGAIAEYAEEHGAFVIGLEHRFYGKSQPTSDLSTENLKFLTIPQTIEDIAAFVRMWRTRDEFRNSKWVLFGASYLGSVTAWFSQKHPELIDAFVASSAPLELRYEIPEFLENVGIILNQTNPKCYDTVAEGFSCLSKVFNEEDCQNYTLADVKEKFEFCAELDRTRPLDATGVFAELFSTINAVVMYHDPSPESFPDTNLDRFCKHITAESDDRPALDKIGDKVKEINKHREVPCAEFRFQTTVDFLKEKEWDSPAAKEGYRQLQWQLCNELGWTVASANISQPFGNYLTPFLHSEICHNLFGLTETEMRLKVLKANTDLKGKALNTQCGIFVNGDKDPWHTFSIVTAEEAGKCNRAILIEGGSHGRDVEDFANNPSYPPQVRQAQLQIANYLNSWLKTGNCCDDDSTENKRVISSLSRSARTLNPKDYYHAFDNLLKSPNVEIKPRSYPADNKERLITSPTSIPYQISTTDVLSVSPRIPVVGSSLGNQERSQTDRSIFRDPENTGFRRYRVVKLLRHRPSFAPPIQKTSPAPSMEQFEAEFPEHSIKVEGRVERVYKNGTVINSTEHSSIEANDQLDLFDKGRRLLQQSLSPNKLPSETSQSTTDSHNENSRKGRFKYVVKQVFKDVVDMEGTNETQDEKLQSTEADTDLSGEDNYKSIEVSPSPKTATKREQSLENINLGSPQSQQKGNDASVPSSSNEDNYSSSTSSSEQQSSFEEPPSSKSLKESSSITEDTGKRSNTEKSKSIENSEDDSISTSESIENSSMKPPVTSNNRSNELDVKGTQKQSKEKTSGNSDEDDDEEEDYEDDYSDEYYDDDDDDDDDDYDDDYESDEDTQNNANKQNPKESKKIGDKHSSNANKTAKTTVKPSPISSKATNFSTEYSSGEDTKPRRLREKISQKIMSSSESVEGDQKSKEKTKAAGRKYSGKVEHRPNSSGYSRESFEDVESSRYSSQEIASGEDYNYSLEPSGSNPKGSYRKKQLAPITKPVIEEPSTIINVEISGSYPRKSLRRKKGRKAKDILPRENSTETLDKTMEQEKQVRKVHRRKKVISENNEHESIIASRSRYRKKSKTTTTTTTKTTTTTTPSTTETIPTTEFSDLTELTPPTNSYAKWNQGKDMGPVEALPIQQEAPTILDLNNYNADASLSPTKTGSVSPKNNDVVYIIIGDIPVDGNPNIINENPSREAIFNFIQKLVNRHSPGIFPTNIQSSYEPPRYRPPPLTTTTTTTTTTAPPVISNHEFPDPTGKYLLVRPVQVVSLGRDRVVHAQDLKDDSLMDLMTMETPLHPYPYQSQGQNTKRQHSNPASYRFKSPHHRDHFERLLSVDGQVRDSDRGVGFDRHSFKRLDQIPDPGWRSIRGVSQLGPVIPSKNPTAGLLSLTAADTMWVDEGVPFLPRHRQLSTKSHQKWNSAK